MKQIAVICIEGEKVQLCGHNGITDAKLLTCEGQRSSFFIRILGIMHKNFGSVVSSYAEHMSWSLEDNASVFETPYPSMSSHIFNFKRCC